MMYTSLKLDLRHSRKEALEIQISDSWTQPDPCEDQALNIGYKPLDLNEWTCQMSTIHRRRKLLLDVDHQEDETFHL